MMEFEDRLGKVVEGTFGAMFRSSVQPAELARAASKEMARSRKLGLGKMYVSNVYFTFISQRDADTMGDLIPTIEGELETYLLAFARERDYSFVTRPVVRFSVDPKLKRQGKFDIVSQQMTAEAIYTELGSVPGITDEIEAAEVEHHPSLAPIGSVDSHAGPMSAPAPDLIPPAPVAPEPVPLVTPDDPWAAAPAAGAAAVVAAMPETEEPVTEVILHASIITPDQGEISIDPGRSYVAGRQSTCDFPVSDANVSRQHAEIYWNGQSWSVRDLGSTNGTHVNNQEITDTPLQDGDQITLGITTLTFHEFE